MAAQVLLPLAVNSNSERIVDSLLPLGLKHVISGTQALLSDRLDKLHPHPYPLFEYTQTYNQTHGLKKRPLDLGQIQDLNN
jgi:hypothetical protein